MRVVYAGLLLAGLVLVGASVYQSRSTGQATMCVMEDGSPMPPPNGPPPKPAK